MDTPFLLHKSGRWCIPWNAANASHPDMRPMTGAQYEEWQAKEADRVRGKVIQNQPETHRKTPAPLLGNTESAPDINQELSGGVEDDR